MWIRYMTIFGTLGAAWYGQLLYGQTSFGLSTVLALVVGVCCAMVGHRGASAGMGARTR